VSWPRGSLGILWGLWHIIPMVIWPSVAYSAPSSPGLYIAIRTVSFLVGGLVAFRVLMLWVYDRTHSLLLMILMHIGLTAVNIIYEPEAISGTSNYIADFVGAAAQWIVAAVVIVANRGQLSRPPLGDRSDGGRSANQAGNQGVSPVGVSPVLARRG